MSEILGVNLNKLKIVGLDFETYFAKDYSLADKETSTSEYIRDPRFKAQCVGIRTEQMTRALAFHGERMTAELATIDWSNTAMLAHHCSFDALILKEHFGHVPAFYLDTLSMARVLHSHDVGNSLDEIATHLGLQNKIPDVLNMTKGIRELPPRLMSQLKQYCARDVDIMWEILMRWWEDFPMDEYYLIDLTIRMFADPVLEVNLARARRELNEQQRIRSDLLEKARKILRVKTQEEMLKILGSAPKFAQALRKIGVEPPMKTSPSNPDKQIFAFAKSDHAFQRLVNSPIKKVKTLATARTATKSTIGITRATRVIDHAKPAFPVYLNYGKAHTLRWTGGDLVNPQNFVRGGRLRRSLRAPPGYVVVVVDSNQIEDRFNCWWSGQDDFLKVYAEGGDPYKAMAAKIYDIPEKEVTKEQRFLGKVARLGGGYGCGVDRLHNIFITGQLGPPVDLSRDQTEEIHTAYRETNSKIVDNWTFMGQRFSAMSGKGKREYTHKCVTFGYEHVRLPNGLRLFYPDIQTDEGGNLSYKSSKRGRSRIWGGHFFENIDQCLSRIIVGEQMLEISYWYRIVMMTHDEVAYLARISEAKEALAYGIECLSRTPGWAPGLPLAAEGGFAKNYGDAK